MDFYTGLHQPSDAKHFEMAFVSVNRLKNRKSPFQCQKIILDSGAFTIVSTHGEYPDSVETYARQIVHCKGLIEGRIARFRPLRLRSPHSHVWRAPEARNVGWCRVSVQAQRQYPRHRRRFAHDSCGAPRPSAARIRTQNHCAIVWSRSGTSAHRRFDGVVVCSSHHGTQWKRLARGSRMD